MTRKKIFIIIIIIIIELTSKYGREGQQGAGSQQMEDQLSFVLSVRVLANGQGFSQVSVINRGQMLEWVLIRSLHLMLQKLSGEAEGYQEDSQNNNHSEQWACQDSVSPGLCTSITPRKLQN